MNKKIVLIAVVVIFLVLGGIMFLWTRPLSMSLEQIFPAHAFMYARLTHVAEDIEAISKNDFWKTIASIDFPKVLEKNKASAGDVKEMRRMQQEVEMFLKSPLTEKVLGKEIALGVYPKDHQKDQNGLEAYDVLFATRLGAAFQMGELFVSMAKEWSDDVTTSDENRRGFKIVHVHFKKRKVELQYLRIKDVLFISTSPSKILYQVIDVYQRLELSLARDSNFSKALSHAYVKGHGIFYLNFESLISFLKEHFVETKEENNNQVNRALGGFKSYSISFLPGEISKIKMMMNFDSTYLTAYWKALFECAPKTNTSLKFVPHNVMAYQWADCYDFKGISDEILNQEQLTKQARESVELVKKQIEKKLKFKIREDFLDILGSQAGGYLNDVDTQGLFPYPRLVAFIKFKDRSLAENLMKKFEFTPLGAMQQEPYQQVIIHYISLPLGANMDLGYIFLDDYLLLGSSRQLLKTSIDAYNSPDQSFQSTDALKQFSMDSSQLNQSIAFVKMSDMAIRLQQLLDWYNKLVSAQITAALSYQKEGYSQQKELDESIDSKKDELSIAQKKLEKLKSKVLVSEATEEEITNHKENIAHLSSDVKLLKEDLNDYKTQKNELEQNLLKYEQKAEDAKLWLFNSDECIKPMLKALESIHALGLQVHASDQVSETEIFIK